MRSRGRKEWSVCGVSTGQPGGSASQRLWSWVPKPEAPLASEGPSSQVCVCEGPAISLPDLRSTTHWKETHCWSPSTWKWRWGLTGASPSSRRRPGPSALAPSPGLSAALAAGRRLSWRSRQEQPEEGKPARKPSFFPSFLPLPGLELFEKGEGGLGRLRLSPAGTRSRCVASSWPGGREKDGAAPGEEAGWAGAFRRTPERKKRPAGVLQLSLLWQSFAQQLPAPGFPLTHNALIVLWVFF